MAYDSGKRLLLYALVKGLGDAVRRNDSRLPSAIAEGSAWPPNRLLPMIDDPVQDALKKLLLISGRWVVAPVVTMSPKGEGSERYVYRSDRDEPKQQMLELIERVIGLLPVGYSTRRYSFFRGTLSLLPCSRNSGASALAWASREPLYGCL